MKDQAVLLLGTLLVLVVGARPASPPPDLEPYKRGLEVFQQRCYFCHGAKADGRGPLADQIKGTRPADFRRSHYAEMSPDTLLRTIRLGGVGTGKNPVMPPFEGALTLQEMQDLVVFIQTVSRYGKVVPPEQLVRE